MKHGTVCNLRAECTGDRRGTRRLPTLHPGQARAGKWVRERPVPPLLIASTLLVPGYIEAEEIRRLACFIASIDRDIPYSLLAFHPHFRMADLPVTTRVFAEQCLDAALAEGLRRVRLGNVRLLA